MAHHHSSTVELRRPEDGHVRFREPSGDGHGRQGGGAVKALAAAAALGAMALYSRVKARQAEQAHPPMGQFMEVGGVRLHFVERGQGEPLVLLHGRGTMIEDFELSGVLDMAAAGHRVVAFDRPGFGHSERPRDRLWTPVAQAELLLRALDRLDVDRAILLGHSWGTMVANALALGHPDRVRGLVLVSGYYFPTLRKEVPLQAPMAIPVVGDVMRYTVSPLLSALLLPKAERKLFEPLPVPERFRQGFPHALTLRPSQLRATGEDTAFEVPAAMVLQNHYRELKMPIVIVVGTDDQIVDVDRQSRRLHAELPGSDLITVPGAGHMVHYKAPDRVMAAVELVERRAGEANTAAARPAEPARATQSL